MEMMSLLPDITMMARVSQDAASIAMQQLADDAELDRPGLQDARGNDWQPVSVKDRWKTALRATADIRRRQSSDEENHLRCGQVKVTATSLRLEGPLVDRSNRVLRMYPKFHDNFLRVTFSEENLMSTRFANDKEIRQSAFVKEHFGNIMKEGLKLAGRTFQFLAYSQSSLKDGTVWFVYPFDDAGVRVTAEGIRAKLGDFSLIITKPARYAARLSQAFSATSRSVILRATEVEEIPDIERNGSCFSDGVGGISPALAEEVTERLFARSSTSGCLPSAFQIRFGGCKGMLFVNPALRGRKITIRRSMKKFDAPAALDLEIAEVFVDPKPCLLNRPLIKILEDLGTPIDAFLAVQQRVINVVDAQASRLSTSSILLQNNGLGGIYNVPTLLRNLASLQLEFEDFPSYMTHFFKDSLTFAKVSILRDVKFHGRVPLERSFTLVGGVDEYFTLEAGEIYICIEPTPDVGQREATYIAGDVAVTRSPAMHPGDVRMLKAVGSPRSAFLRAQKNVIIFSAKGDRSECSKMGGGDLDGDIYNVITQAHRDLWPRHMHVPADYAPAIIKDLGRPSTIKDVADFVADYLNTDLLGMVATRHLIIADQQESGTKHADCLKLSKLHSDAVDFPKSGTPVDFAQLPRAPQRLKPDFMSPETLFKKGDSSAYYPSQKALGVLARNVDIPDVITYNRNTRSNKSHLSTSIDVVSSEARQKSIPNLPYVLKIRAAVTEHLGDINFDGETIDSVEGVMREYRWELQRISNAYRVSGKRITEEELFMSVLGAQVKDKRRKDQLAQVKEESTFLVHSVRAELGRGNENLEHLESELSVLRHAYCAWAIALRAGDAFGAVSFQIIALQVIFKTIKGLQQISIDLR